MGIQHEINSLTAIINEDPASFQEGDTEGEGTRSARIQTLQFGNNRNPLLNTKSTNIPIYFNSSLNMREITPAHCNNIIKRILKTLIILLQKKHILYRLSFLLLL